jgi:hypothetical protein
MNITYHPSPLEMLYLIVFGVWVLFEKARLDGFPSIQKVLAPTLQGLYVVSPYILHVLNFKAAV